MWIDIGDKKYMTQKAYPVWLKNNNTGFEFSDIGLWVDGTWYLDMGDTNIDRTPYEIIAYYIVPDYK